jgi:NTE family protein
MKIGVVLGAGGLIGIAWLMGAIEALQDETGWDPADADRLIGTSAGAIVAALVAQGEHRATDGARQWPPADLTAIGRQRPALAVPSFGPGSWPLTVRALRHPSRHTPLTLYSALMPKGPLSVRPVQHLIRRRVPAGWSAHPGLWIVACDYATGRRVPFGREGCPPAHLADAVAASCAIPGTYEPVRIGGRRYVDGGMYSTSNLDLLRHDDLDLAICFNPTSTLHPTHAWNPLQLTAKMMRAESGKRLGRETRRLRERGTNVVLIQPTRTDLEAMGINLMSRSDRRHRRVLELARITVGEQLRRPEHRAALTALAPPRAAA